MNYGDVISWCIQNSAVFRFCERRSRSEFIITNESIPGDKALEVAVTREDGKVIAVHAPLDSSTEPSKAVARALIAAVGQLAERQGVTSANGG